MVAVLKGNNSRETRDEIVTYLRWEAKKRRKQAEDSLTVREIGQQTVAAKALEEAADYINGAMFMVEQPPVTEEPKEEL